MKKFSFFISTFILLFGLVGCQKKEATPKVPNSINQQLVLANKKLAVFHKNEPLPTSITNPTKRKYLAVTSQNRNDNYVINYGFTKKYVKFGEQPESQTTVARFSKNSLLDEQAAQKEIKMLDQKDLGQAKMDLGNNQMAYLMRDNMHLYIAWFKDNFSILISANSTKGEKPESLAKKINQKLQTTHLPITNRGSAIFFVRPNKDKFGSVLKWQDPKNTKNVYALSALNNQVLTSMLK